jgi:hypothetical protein
LKNIIGLFDTYSPIDYVTHNLNIENNITTICVPHGINFKQKVNYISYGTNVYTFWSENHLNRMEESNISHLKEVVSKIFTGNVVYKNTLESIQENKINNKKILVVGEYFSEDNYYSSPFNRQISKDFFDVLSQFLKEHDECSMTIRTRLNDEYSKLASLYINNKIKMSNPMKPITDEINDHDLVVSVFSNALHEGLLLEKKVLQVNLFGIENYRDLASNGLVYYADTKNDFSNILDEWYQDNLYSINYKKHLKEYANDGVFEKLELRT